MGLLSDILKMNGKHGKQTFFYKWACLLFNKLILEECLHLHSPGHIQGAIGPKCPPAPTLKSKNFDFQGDSAPNESLSSPTGISKNG